MTDAPIPITVLGGYLGAGKTTLLNRLLSEPSDHRLGVVVNDFGELGVDAALLASAAGEGDGSVPVVNLVNGCVCCTLGDDLRATIETLAAVEPRLDHIVIEASGVADPATAAAWGTVPGFLPGGVVVLAAADAVIKLAGDRYVGNEVVRQLAGADLVVLTKTDRVDEARIAEVRTWIAGHTASPIVVANHGRLSRDIVLGTMHRDHREPSAAKQAHRGPSPYVTWTTTTDVIAEESLARFLDHLPVGALRAKGFVQVTSSTGAPGGRLVQVVGRTVTITPCDVPNNSAIEVIGTAELDVPALEALATDHLRAS